MEISWPNIIFYLLVLYFILNLVLSTKLHFNFAKFRGKTYYAKRLLEYLMVLMARRGQFQIESKGAEASIPRYKFYTPIIRAILQREMELGVPIREHLKNLRQCLIKDWEFEQKLATHLFSCVGQIASLVFMTWGFGLFCKEVLELWPSSDGLLLVAALQLFGIGAFFVLYQKRKVAVFCPYEKCYHALISAMMFHQLGLSLQDTASRCSLKSLPQKGKLGHLRGRLEELFCQCLHSGHSIKDFLAELRDEANFYLEEDFKGFLRFTGRIKFLILAVFYLPAYLVFMLLLFEGLLLQ